MEPRRVRFFFDYVDPLSYLVHRELQALGQAGFAPAGEVIAVPLELCPPPAPILDPETPPWIERWRTAAGIAGDGWAGSGAPTILPWTRKAHELAFHAREKGLGGVVHDAIFEAVFARGEDVGRVDVLVDLARRLGLDPMEAKAVLDVDRFAGSVADLRAEAAAAGVTGPPALLVGDRTLRGFHNRDAVRTFLLR